MLDTNASDRIGLQLDTMPRRIEEGSKADDRKDRPVQTANVCAPMVVSLQGEYLVCDANRIQSRPPGSGILDVFLTLADAEPGEILKYGRKWGALCIGSKAIPGVRFLEPLAAWRATATRFRALHRIGAEINAKQVGAGDEWDALGMDLPKRSGSTSALEEARFGLMEQARLLVQEARLQPRLYWNPQAGQWQIDFDAYSK